MLTCAGGGGSALEAAGLWVARAGVAFFAGADFFAGAECRTGRLRFAAGLCFGLDFLCAAAARAVEAGGVEKARAAGAEARPAAAMVAAASRVAATTTARAVPNKRLEIVCRSIVDMEAGNQFRSANIGRPRTSEYPCTVGPDEGARDCHAYAAARAANGSRMVREAPTGLVDTRPRGPLTTTLATGVECP